MSRLALNLRIKGDFIDSFIYSGVLYLLDTDFNFTSYSWNEICDFILRRNGFRNIDASSILEYTKDNRRINNCIEHIDTDINECELISLKKDVVNIKNWPSDINLFSNKLYYSGDDGVYYIQTNHLDASFEKTTKSNKIFGVKSFSISPNSHMRVALAAGNEGVFTSCYYFNAKRPSEQKISTSSCIDIDWMNNFLFINSNDLLIKKFHDVIGKSEIDSDQQYQFLKNELFNSFDKNNDERGSISKHVYRKYIEDVLNKRPDSLNLKDKYRYGWSSGDCDFLVRCDNNLIIHNNITGKTKEVNIKNKNLNLLKVRTSGCGTFMEADDGSLYALNKEGVSDKISDDYVSWRVYPRAKNHANHLHIVNDDNINVRVYNRENISHGLNTFLSKNNNDHYKYNLKELEEQ
jgi:hypothetical protein